MKQIAMDCEDIDDAFGMLLSFVDDVYTYLGIEMPYEFNPDEELVRVVQAVKDIQDGIQKPKS